MWVLLLNLLDLTNVSKCKKIYFLEIIILFDIFHFLLNTIGLVSSVVVIVSHVFLIRNSFLILSSIHHMMHDVWRADRNDSSRSRS